MILTKGETIQRLRAGSTYDQLAGQNVADWSTATALDITNCALDAGSRISGRLEFQADRQPIALEPILYAPADADILERDKVIVRGVTYWCGRPFLWVNPYTGLAEGVEVKLTAVDG